MPLPRAKRIEQWPKLTMLLTLLIRCCVNQACHGMNRDFFPLRTLRGTFIKLFIGLFLKKHAKSQRFTTSFARISRKVSIPNRFRTKMELMKMFESLSPERQGQPLAWTVFRPGGNSGANGQFFSEAHTNATSKRWHLWEIESGFALKSSPGWYMCHIRLWSGGCCPGTEAVWFFYQP